MKLLLLIGCALSASVAVGCAVPMEEDEAGSDSNLTMQRDELAKIREAVKDVDQEHVVFPPGVGAPTDSAGTGVETEHGALFGIDWYQKWPGGRTADHEWSTGSRAGQRCMWASVARFEAIMSDAPPELTALLADYTKWDGSFYNWNDDYSGKGPGGEAAYGEARRARLWAWRTGLSNWVSATAKDGSCYLPTRKMLVAFVSACRDHIAANGGEMQGCEVLGGE